MTCQHWWRIQAPNGPTSLGVCKLCGATHTFFNSQDDYEPASLTLAHYKLRPNEAYRE